jgi:gliding motility-associated lipoprotein GldH
MKLLKNLLLLIFTAMLFVACNDGAIVDTFEAVPNQNWTYIKPIKASINVEDSTKTYHIYINFRHTVDYKYANIWLRLHVIGPKLKDEPLRQEFQLALPNGEWLGSGTGNLFSYQLIFKEGYKFPSKGKYTILVEQNMRDNPLKDISDVGVRIVEAK